MRLILLPLLFLPVTGGCSGTGEVQRIEYQCDNDYRMQVELTADKARVILHDRTLELSRQPQMKGERYLSEDHQNLFLRRGNSAVLAVSAGHGMLRCTENKTDP
jgi:membrane-bound inhibitor of C-type lysozyme